MFDANNKSNHVFDASNKSHHIGRTQLSSPVSMIGLYDHQHLAQAIYMYMQDHQDHQSHSLLLQI